MKFLSTILILFLGFSGFTQEQVRNFDLQECLRYATNNSPLKRQFYLAQQRREMQWQLQKSKDLPQVRVYANYSYFLELPTYIFPEEEGRILSSGDSEGTYPIRLGQPHNLFAGARVSQTLFDKRWLSSRDFENLNSDILELSEQATEEEVILQVATTFFDLQKLRSKSQLIGERIENLEKISKILELQSEQKVVNKVEVDKVRLTIARLKAQNTRLSGAIKSQTSKLRLLAGISSDSEVSFNHYSDDLELVVNVAETNESTKINLLEKQEQFGVLMGNSIAADYFPKVKAFADFQFQAQRSSLNFISDEQWFPSHVVGLGINFPIFTGFEKRTKIQEEGVKVEEIKLNKEMAQSQEEIERQNAQSDLETSRQVLQNVGEQKELVDVIYEQVELQYKEGVGSLSELLAAEIDRSEVNNQYEEAIFDYKLAQINYLKSSGGLRALLR